MSTIVLQLALLFLPGLVWERMHAVYSLKDKPDQFDVLRARPIRVRGVEWPR